jgi:hypothetical protein
MRPTIYGYCATSAFIKRFKKKLLALGAAGNGARPKITVTKLLVFPFKDSSIAFDAIAEGLRGPNFIVLRVEIDSVMLASRGDWPAMPSMQSPNILDWRQSPGSFSMAGVLVIGEDGCETLLPSNLASQLVRFRQMVTSSHHAVLKSPPPARRPDIKPVTTPGGLPTGDVYLGFLVEYHSEWYPLGHSLGRIAYSLPLAPGEKVQFAVVDWARTDTTTRTEVTGETEQLNNDTLRDRSISQAVNMVVQESQAGNSSMWGLGLSAGAGVPIGPISIGLGAAFGLGGAHSSTAGIRSVVEHIHSVPQSLR